MPRIKRWFPVSHDFLDDPETIELSSTFGDRSVFMWLRMLSWSDRNEGELGTAEQIASTFGRCIDQAHPNRAAGKAALIVRWMLTQGWVEPHLSPTQGAPNADPSVMYIAKFAKYHRTEEPKPLPPDLPDQTEPLKNHKNDSPRPASCMSVQELVESWNESFDNKLPKVEWPLSDSRKRKATMRLKEHIALDFWQQVFDNVASSSFLLGTGNGNWRCTFDFLIANENNCLKIYEGVYSNDKNRK